MSIVVLENYINGEFVASAATETLDLINPVDESVVGRTPVSTKEDVDAAVEAAQRAFETWGKTTPSVRQAALLKLADASKRTATKSSQPKAPTPARPTR